MTCEDKIQSVEELYDRLHRYIWWLAHDINKDHTLNILLQTDDLAGELFLEMVRVYRHYEDRGDLDADSLIKIVKVSLDNRIRTLIYTYHNTHRAEDSKVLPLNVIECEPSTRDVKSNSSYGGGGRQSWYHHPTDEYTIPDPQSLAESSMRLQIFLDKLTDPEREIVEAILCMDERVARQAQLIGTRKAFVTKKGGTVSLNYRFIADALHIDRKECQALWGQIRRKWRGTEKL